MVESLKSRYLEQLNGLRQALTNRLQQDSAPRPRNIGQLEKFNLVLNQTLAYLNVPKSKIMPSDADKLDTLQMNIHWILQLTGKKSGSSPQEGKHYPDIYSVQQLAQPQTQTSEVHQIKDHKIPPLQFTKSQSMPAAKQKNNLMFLQHVSKFSSPEPLHQSTMHSRESLAASEKENSVNMMQQVAKESLGSPKSIPQENLDTLLPISHMNGLQSSVFPFEMSSNTLQNFHLKQTKEQPDVLAQKPELVFQKPNMQQQLVREKHPILHQQAPKPQVHVKQQIQLNEVHAPTGCKAAGSIAEQPIKRLINMVNSIPSKVFSAAIGDIGSVIGITDRISSSLPANGSRAAIGEDFVAMTKSSLQARYLKGWNDISGTRKRNRCTNWIASNPSPMNVSMNDGFRQWIDMEKPELESSMMSHIKQPTIEAKLALLEEIRKINQQLIDTVVVICDEHTISTGCGEGTIVMCSFTAVATCPNFKSGLVSSQVSPIQPLKLIVPANYPHTSPDLLGKMPVAAREDHQDLSVKVISKLNSSLSTLSKPFSVWDIARMWDFCVRTVVLKYALQNGGGNFSSKYGTWETCLGAT